MKEITKDEFLKLTHTPEDCWIFAVPDVKHWFMKDETSGIIYYINSDGDVMRFKRMEKVEETLVSEARWNIWSVWEAD